MEKEMERERRMAALCNRKGKMWSKNSVVKVIDEIPEGKIEECKLTLLGKLHSKPSVNFQAFQ